MKNSIGIDTNALVREARKAMRAMRLVSGGIAAPVSGFGLRPRDHTDKIPVTSG